ncbi:MAG TPA: hypothetical protein VMB19_15015 [Silvibacterium sp.]|nr:hypothetical protein [Silvibacterium sp.]
MHKVKNPNELVERYLQAVRFWLPKTKNEEGLIAEFGDDLRSQIEAREAELGRSLNEEEVGAILKRCGAPMFVASRLGPKQSLIGPALFPIYRFVLKMVVIWVLIPVFLIVLAPINIVKAGGPWASALAATLGGLWSAAFVAAGVITLVFAVLERTHALDEIESKWDPSTLPPLEKPEKKPTPLQNAAEFAFGFFGLIWLLLLPAYPFLIMGPGAVFLQASPLIHTLYPLLVAVAALSVLRTGLILARPRWNQFTIWSELAHKVVTFVFLSFVLRFVEALPAANWHPFVMPSQSMAASAQSVKVAAIVNVSILVGLLIGWFTTGIATIVHAWQMIQRKRDSRNQPQPAASLHAH